MYQLGVGTTYRLEDMPGAMENRDGWQESFKGLRAINTNLWWLVAIKIE